MAVGIASKVKGAPYVPQKQGSLRLDKTIAGQQAQVATACGTESVAVTGNGPTAGTKATHDCRVVNHAQVGCCPASVQTTVHQNAEYSKRLRTALNGQTHHAQASSKIANNG